MNEQNEIPFSSLSMSDQTRWVLEQMLDGAIREVETVGDCELPEFMDRLSRWIDTARNQLKIYREPVRKKSRAR